MPRPTASAIFGEQPFFLKIFDLERFPPRGSRKEECLSEVEMCARLEHPSLVACRRTLGIESIGDKRYALITDYIQGGLLAELLSREHRLPVAQAVELTIRAGRVELPARSGGNVDS